MEWNPIWMSGNRINMKLLLALCLALALTGCARYQPRVSKSMVVYGAQVNKELASPTWLLDYQASPAVSPEQKAVKLQQRNHLISEFIWNIDRSYDRFEIQFYSNKATNDIAGDFLGLGLTGAATLAGAPGTKTILSLIASTAVGGKASIDLNWYNSETRETIVSQMRALRATQLIVLEEGMNQPLEAYSLDQGIRDAQAYYQAGSVVSALQAIANNASNQAASAKAALQQARLARAK